MCRTPKWVLLVLLLCVGTATGCSHLILQYDDDPAVTTARVAGRVMLGVITLPALIVGQHSELTISRIKDTAAITDGYHLKLPPARATVVVLGDHPIASGAAVTWLQKRGLTIVERTALQKVFSEQQIRLTHTPDDEAAFLKVGQLIGASAIVFVDTASSGGAVSQSSVYVSKYGGFGGSSSSTVSSSGISVRAVDVENGSLVWTGHAHFRQMSSGAPEDALVKLVCQALATAWGFRPTGDDFVPSQKMCELQDPRPQLSQSNK